MEQNYSKGTLFFVFEDSFLGSIKKFITRRSFVRVALYLDINGTPMILTDRRGVIVFEHLEHFLNKNKDLVQDSIPLPAGHMRRVLKSFGSKGKASVFIARLINIGDPEKYSSDLLYKKLKE